MKRYDRKLGLMRTYLKKGAQIRVPGGILYNIIGEPIGEGGGSIIYPALRATPDKEGYRRSNIIYALKECFPKSDRFLIERNADGQIIALPKEGDRESGEKDAEDFLNRAKKMQKEEENISSQVYVHAFRLTPIIESYQEIELAQEEGQNFVKVSNMISIMESLSGKGESLKSLLKEKKNLSVYEAFPVIRQLLLAVKEVHQEGFIHLDIQDGNVFLKGVLSEGDHAVSIIDFGSARPLRDDGLCEEIRDGILYSTQGFSAPEILWENDGHLRLGKETDIYSVGCLLLLLLTGHRYTTRELVSNQTGRYIPRFAVRKTKCPRHLMDKMQAIIARALKKAPEERYASAKEMLVDVDEMLALLAPHKDPISAVDYSAFISYKHGEKDSAAAMALRNALERYKSGMFEERKIKRVFMDEGELSSCADYGESIHQVLKKTPWLILICSKRTRESKWVNEEIKTFLKYHDKDHVLAVLIEGEPEEVYPDELIKNGFHAENLLAADARAEDIKGIVKKIKGDGKLRLAAPILNTTFDALKQRNKMYLMQRTFALSGIALCALAAFTTYAAIKEKQISQQAEAIIEEQNEKIEYQADLLAQQAQRAYDATDYSEAIRLANESRDLSGENEERQSNLKKILVDCQHLYVRPSEADMLPVPVGYMDDPAGGGIFSCFLNQDGSRLFSVSAKSFCTWDTKDNSLVSCFEEEEFLNKYKFYQKKNLLEKENAYVFWSQKSLVCYNYEKGQISWSKDIKDDNLKIQKVLLSEDEQWIYCISYSLLDKNVEIEMLDAAKGQIKKDYKFKLDKNMYLGAEGAVSSDGKYLAFAAYAETEEGSGKFENFLLVFNLQDQTTVIESLGAGYNWSSDEDDSLLFTDDGKILFSLCEGPVNILVSIDSEHSAQGISPKHYFLYCYDYKNKKMAWHYEKNGDDDNDLSSSVIPFMLRSEKDGKKIVSVAVENTFVSIDEKSGDVLYEKQFDGTIELVDDNGKRIRIVLDNGNLLKLDKDFNEKSLISLVAVDCFAADVNAVCVYKDNFYVTNKSAGSKIVKYQLGKYDESYREENVSGISPKEWIESLPADDSKLEDKETKLVLDENESSFEIIGQGQEKKKSIKVEVNEAVKMLSLTPSGDKIFVGTENSVLLYDLEGKQISKTVLSKTLEYGARGYILYFPEKNTCFYGDRSNGYLMDVNSDGVEVIRSIKNVAAYDAKSGEFMMMEYELYTDEDWKIEYFKYHSF